MPTATKKATTGAPGGRTRAAGPSRRAGAQEPASGSTRAPRGGTRSGGRSAAHATAAGNAGAGATRRSPAHPRQAAETAERHHSVQVSLPLLGTMRLPATDELAFLGGVAALAVIGALEWPVAVAVGAGHALAAKHRNKVVREFGEALEAA